MTGEHRAVTPPPAEKEAALAPVVEAALPPSASSLPLIGLAGLLALAAALGVRATAASLS